MADYQQEKMLFKWRYRPYILAAVIAFIMFTMIRPIISSGDAMEPLISHGQLIIVNKETYKYKTPPLQSLVSFWDDLPAGPREGDNPIRRVIAGPGDQIEIRDGDVILNGEILDESDYVNGVTEGEIGPITIDEGHVFVLGDNRENCMDSRHAEIGQVKATDLRGTCSVVLWPISEWKVIK